MTETILVIGATGTLGSEVVKQLSNNSTNYLIRAAVHSIDKAKEIDIPRVNLVQIDYNKPDTLNNAFRGVDRLFLLTHPSPNTVEQEFNIINEAKKVGVKHIVKQSVMGADDDDPKVELIRLHREAEKLVEESGIEYTFLRPNEFMQNFVTFHGPTIKNTNSFYLPMKNAEVSVVDVRDIAAVAVKALTEKDLANVSNKAFTITGPKALSYNKMAELLSNATNRKIEYVNISEEDARSGMKEADMNDWLINALLELNGYFREGHASHVTSIVENITGKSARTFEEFAKDYVDFFR
ncbi:SDR family oxidoreductase [Candidatus Nitrosocosmicus franklandus]|uniref:NAD(P)-dependent oxidoreductase n=1 Tax=Candidatus Nitrosocosmicus franklandianus TaxID=1798806 RepID=A0A484I9R1_9ARCH|nr:SDR family oxidoreductase [Candidatus Nitrosocosmicus franklandus]VFJ14460.1 NAD(P)-dependent oxidoreductase [Candidatus Nitrosocosmicus franklandus]